MRQVVDTENGSLLRPLGRGQFRCRARFALRRGYAMRTGFVALLLVLGRLSCPAVAQDAAPLAATVGAPGDTDLMCLPESPVVATGASLNLRAWSSLPGATYRWSAEAGELSQGETAQVRWTAVGTVPGRSYSMRVTVSAPGSNASTCSLQVVAVLPDLELKGEGRIDRRLFVYPGEATRVEGFGLYSYFLVPKAPIKGSDAEQRILATLVELLRFPDFDELKTRAQVTRIRSLHVVQLLLKSRADAGLSSLLDRRDWDRAAVWVLDHYDFNSSLLLAESIAETRPIGEGPYFVSLGAPHRFGEDIVGPYLFQDHSKASARLAALWINGFLNQAWQDKYWEPRVFDRILVRTRTEFETAARATGAMREGLAAMARAWVKIGNG